MIIMENSVVSGLRSRSRSKTPFLRSSCDRENCDEVDDHVHHKTGRRTPSKRSTPIRLSSKGSSSKAATEPILETNEEKDTATQRTRRSIKSVTEKFRTSDYSSEESPDRLKNSIERSQNQANYSYEYQRVTTSQSAQSSLASLGDLAFSPINASHNVSGDRPRFGSPTYSACSTDSSFAEQTLVDASIILERDPQHSLEHLPSRLYKMAGEYWNKYPKTDYTYSRLSKDRVELAPGQVAVPNMSRRSLANFRIQGPSGSQDEVDFVVKQNYSNSLRHRFKQTECSDDEDQLFRGNGGYIHQEDRWWITRLLISIVTTITTTTSAIYRKLAGPAPRYPYTGRNTDTRGSFLRSAGSKAAAPFYWIYTIIKKVVTTTVTTVTETINPPSNVYAYNTRSKSARYEETKAKRRWWPWLLLLLLPIVGYGCYYQEDIMSMVPELPRFVETPPSEQPAVNSYKAPVIIQDPNLSKRIAALEDWAVAVDSKLNSVDIKLSKIDQLEARMEAFNIENLQKNIVQIFNMNNENGEAIAGKLKEYFDEYYVSKDQMSTMSKDIHEKIVNSWKPEMDEDRIQQIVKEYLVAFERRQLEILMTRVKEYVKEVEVHHVSTGFDVDAVKKIVASMLEVYDADKTGIVDYALESAGGQVISTRCTELYNIKTKQYYVLGFPVMYVYTSPRYALTPGAMPAECWAFQGFPGYLIIKTYAIIEVTGFSLEHMSKLLAADGKIESAPKNFSVYGLQDEQDLSPHLFGNYMYDANGTSIQYFPVQFPKTEVIGEKPYPVAFDLIELRVESNHGNPTYTCVYRFRVHGNPLSDIRRATEDSIRDSEY